MRRAKAAVKKLMLAAGVSKRALQMTSGILVLCYHSVPDRGDWLYDVTLHDFEKQVDFLRQNYQIIRASEVLTQRVRGEAMGLQVVLTFDDGFEDNFVNVFPAIVERDIPVTFFLTVGYVAPVKNKLLEVSPGIRKRLMNWDQVREMTKSSLVDFGSHGLTHRDMTRLSRDAALADMKESREVLEKELERPVSLFSYPGGFFTAETNSLLATAGYTGGFTSVAQVNRPGTPPFEMGRVAIARRNSDLASFAYLLGRVVKADGER